MSDPLANQKSSSYTQLRLEWTLATTFGFAYGMGIAASALIIFTYMESILVSIIPIVLSGAVIGLAQWIVLRRYIQKGSWWIYATILGWVLGLIVAVSFLVAFSSALASWLFSNLNESVIEKTLRILGSGLGLAVLILIALVGGILGASVGSTLGLMQSIFLGRQVHRASHWITVSIVSWALGSAIGLVTVTALLAYIKTSIFAARETSIILAVFISIFAIFGAITGVIAGACTGIALANLLKTDQLVRSSISVPLVFNRWRQSGILARTSSLIGIIGLLVSAGFAVFLISGELVARLLDFPIGYGSIVLTAGDPCDYPEMTIEVDRRTITEKETVIIGVNLSNRSTQECEATVELYSPNFDISPQQESQTFNLASGETIRVIWVLSPRETGTYQIWISSGREGSSIGIIVTNVLGVTAYQAQLLTYLGTFFSSSLTFPWLYTVWQERRKEKLEEKEKRDEQFQKLKRQVNALKAHQKNKK